MKKKSDNKINGIITVLLGLCIVFARVIMPTSMKINKGLVILETLLELLICLVVIYINREKLIKILKLKKKEKMGSLIEKVCIVFGITQIGTSFIYLLLNILTHGAIGSAYDPANEVGVAFQNTLPLAVMFTQCITAPICEEIVFRLTMSDLIPNKIVFVLLSSLLFGFIHNGFFFTLGIVYYALYGVAMAISYIYVKDIRCLILVHMLSNIIATISSLI